MIRGRDDDKSLKLPAAKLGPAAKLEPATRQKTRSRGGDGVKRLTEYTQSPGFGRDRKNWPQNLHTPGNDNAWRLRVKNI
jgi:hypothetical protein